jgi:hypothetical protein
MASFFRYAKRALIAGLALAALDGCSRQGPGERCDTANGSNDCQDGLVCVSKETLRGNASLCCPAGQIGPESIVPGCTYGATTVVQDSGVSQSGDAASDGAANDASGGADATDGATSAPDGAKDGAAPDGAAPDGAAPDGAKDGAATDASADGAATDAGADGAADGAGAAG